MDLQYSKNLIKTPDFRGLANLEELDLEGCTKLVEIHPSIGLLRKLRVLNLRNCTSLRSLPYSVFGLSSLEELNLSHCSKVFNNQLLRDGKHAEHYLKKLDVSETAMTCKPTCSILNKFSFQLFNPAKKSEIVGLLLPSFQCLQELNLYFCNLNSIPYVIGSLHGLETLNLGRNNFVALPSTMKDLPRLKRLYLTHCRQLKYLPELKLCTDLLTRTRPECYFYLDIPPVLYIFNCPKLIGVERWSNIVLLWMIQFIKIHHRSWPRFGDVHCAVPGSQVPMWFGNQSASNRIILEPILMHDSDWIGLALCAAFVTPTILDEDTGEHLTLFTLNNLFFDVQYFSSVLIEKYLVKVESDHFFLLYLPGEALICDATKKYDLLDGIEMSVFLATLVVKNWGFRWVFKRDLELEELTPTMSNLSSEPNTTCWIEPSASKKTEPQLNLFLLFRGHLSIYVEVFS